MARTLFPLDEHAFAHYDFVRGSSIHEQFHPEEEVYEVIEGTVPGNVRHSVKALTDGRAIIVDYPVRRDFDWAAIDYGFFGSGLG
jgi:quercetin dioxygenase-like cupin family protein